MKTTWLWLTAATASAALMTGCFGDDSVSAADAQNSERRTTTATESMNSAMSGMTSSDYDYGNEDLTALTKAHADYLAALQLNPDNASAKFGVAMTEVLIAAQDPKVAEVINRTIDAPSPFDSRLADQAPILEPVLMKKVAKMAATYPAFHELQDALESEMLPALETATQRLNEVFQDPNFTMTFSLDGRDRTVGHSEAGVVLGGLKALHGLLTLFLSYDLDFDSNGSYTYLDDLVTIGDIADFDTLNPQQSAALKKVTELLAPNSTFLAVRPAWKARLAKVTSEFNDAITIAHQAVSSIPTYSSTSASRLLHTCPDNQPVDEWGFPDYSNPNYDDACLDASDISEALDGLDTAKTYLNQPYVMEIPDIDTTIKIQFSAYFNVQDFKKMLPRYGFYPQSEWSSSKPVFYFTDATGRITGNLKDLQDLDDQQSAGLITQVEMVDAMSQIIHFQDPTFQGFLPGATEASLWTLIRKEAAYSDSQNDTTIPVLIKKPAQVMEPQFILEAALR